MKRIVALLMGTALAGSMLAGCQQKTPEEIEAAKFPQVKQNTPEEEKAMRERLHLGGPSQVAPPSSAPQPGAPAGNSPG